MTAFTPDDLRYIAGACLDDGANVPEWRVAEDAEELENRLGEVPTEEQVIRYAVREYHERQDRERGSLALYNTAVF